MDCGFPNTPQRCMTSLPSMGASTFPAAATSRRSRGDDLDTSLIALVQFPSMDALEAFVQDPEYAPFAKARQDGSVSHFHAIDDTDVAGTIPYLPKGSE